MALGIQEGLARKAVPATEIPGIVPKEMWSWGLSLEELVAALPYICIKPQGVSKSMDNEYGQGIPFGPALIDVLQPATSTLTSSMMSMVIIIGMLGMMTKTITTKGVR